MTEKRQTSQGYIIRILQHFATKLRNITNFVMLLSRSKFHLKGERSIWATFLQEKKYTFTNLSSLDTSLEVMGDSLLLPFYYRVKPKLILAIYWIVLSVLNWTLTVLYVCSCCSLACKPFLRSSHSLSKVWKNT
jgi:hypothetical protein